MIAKWLIYAVDLTCVVAALTLAAEYVLRLFGRSTRWLWATSLVLGLMIAPLAWWATPVPAVGPVDAVAGIGAPVVAAASMAAAAPGPSLGQRVVAGVVALEARVDGALPLACVVASLLAALAIGAGYMRLRRQRAGWTERVVDGVPVLVSERIGPAVVGLRRSRIVLPSWVLDEPESRRRMILAHEAEHMAGGDPRLLLGALAAVVVAPWNPAVWWQLRRLRLAAEVDCDARVVRRGADLRGYAGLLLDVGMRFGEGGVLAAFAEPRSLLGRRLRALTAPLPSRRAWRVAGVGLAACALTFAACIAPRPGRPAPALAALAQVQRAPDVEVRQDGVHRPALRNQQESASGAPAVVPPRMAVDTPPPFNPPETPYEVAPELTNREIVRAALIAGYPRVLKAAGIGGRTDVALHVTADGSVAGARVKQASGQPELDAAALKVASQMRFTPAQHGGKPVAVWITVPIVFKTSDGAAAPAAPPPPAGAVPDRPMVAPPAAPTPEQLRQGPVFTPFDAAPELLNREDVRAALVRLYPPDLRVAGKGGTTQIWELLDESGKVLRVLVKKPSGEPAIDSAAVSVGQLMRFSPATLKGQPRSVWIALPIVFRSTPDSPAKAAADTAGATRE